MRLKSRLRRFQRTKERDGAGAKYLPPSRAMPRVFEYASLEITDLDRIPARTRVCLVQHVVLVAVPLVVRIMADGKLRSVQIILVLRADHLGEKPPMLLVFEHHLHPRKRRFVEREVMAPDVLHFVPRRSFVYGRVRVDASRVDHMRAHFPRPFREGIRHILPPAHDA